MSVNEKVSANCLNEVSFSGFSVVAIEVREPEGQDNCGAIFCYLFDGAKR